MLEENNESGEISDCDICDTQELNELFTSKCELTCEEIINEDKYVLHMTGTLNSTPNVAVSLNDYVAQIWNLSDNRLAKLNSIEPYKFPIVDIKWCTDNLNTFYVCCEEGSINLWDIRETRKPVTIFKDTTEVDPENQKPFTCFDVSADGRVLAVGTELFANDAFVLFWDIRGTTLLGGYWESHTDDITQVKFHSTDVNKFISGSTDGLINLYDLTQTSEDDALTDSLNTESSIECLDWYYPQFGKEAIFCSTHVNDVQLWKLDGAEPFAHFHRDFLSQTIKRKSPSDTYVVGPHQYTNDLLILLGSNSKDNALRAVFIRENKLIPKYNFKENKQIVRCSYYNETINTMVTGGENGLLNVWKLQNIST